MRELKKKGDAINGEIGGSKDANTDGVCVGISGEGGLRGEQGGPEEGVERSTHSLLARLPLTAPQTGQLFSHLHKHLAHSIQQLQRALSLPQKILH